MPTFKVSNRHVLQTIGKKKKDADTRKAPMDMFGKLFYLYKQREQSLQKEGAALLHENTLCTEECNRKENEFYGVVALGVCTPDGGVR